MGTLIVCSLGVSAMMLLIGIERFIVARRRDKAGHEMDHGCAPPRR